MSTMNPTLPPIVSLSPLRSAVFGWRSAQSRMLTLVCKATFTLSPAESPLADQQDDVNESDDYWDDDPERSLRQPSDLVPSKPRAEVMLVGSAFAPNGTRQRRVAVRVIVGEVDKALAVFGDHAVQPDGSIGDPSPFAKMALRYERTAGGPETVNPVGIGSELDPYGKRLLPNIVPAGATPSADVDSEPVGFGPIAPRWPLRAARLRNGAAAWAERGDLDVPWPDDFDASYFLAAPWDQRLDALRTNERIVLENLHPSHARLVTNLPGIEPRVFVDVGQGTPHELSMRCDTLWIDSDRGVATLTWRGQLTAERPQPSRIIVASSNSGRRLSWGDVAPLVRESESSTTSKMKPHSETPPAISSRVSERIAVDPIDATAPVSTGTHGPALPFVGRVMTPALASPPPRATPAPPPPVIAKSEATAAPAPSAPAAAVATPTRSDSPSRYSGPRAFGGGAAAKNASKTNAAPDFSVAGSAAALASNAAAGLSGPAPAAAAKAEAPVEAPAPSSGRRESDRAFVDLLWFEPAMARRLRTSSPWKAMLGPEIERRAVDAKGDEEADARERRDIARVLTGSGALDGEALRRAIDEQFDDPAACAHPLVLVSGDLAPSFDEIAMLKAAVQIGTPLGSSDKRLRDAAAVGAEALRGEPPPRETALGLYRSIVEASAKSGGVPIKETITKLLLDQRAFRKRHLFGAPRVRMELSTAKASSPVPVYLPEGAEANLPCLAKFRVRLLAEVRPQEDYAESASESYLGFGLGRVLRGG